MCDPASVTCSYLYLCRQQSQCFVTENDHLLWFGIFFDIIGIVPNTFKNILLIFCVKDKVLF